MALAKFPKTLLHAKWGGSEKEGCVRIFGEVRRNSRVDGGRKVMGKMGNWEEMEILDGGGEVFGWGVEMEKKEGYGEN
jgi:hypothetical protein